MPIIVGWADSSRPTFVDSDMMVVGLEDSAHPTGFICCRQASHNNETAEAATTLTWSSTIHQSEIPEFWLKCQTTSEAAKLAPNPAAKAHFSRLRQTAITAAAALIMPMAKAAHKYSPRRMA